MCLKYIGFPPFCPIGIVMNKTGKPCMPGGKERFCASLPDGK